MTLRPAWWLIRGYLAAWALWSMLGGGTRGIRPHEFLHLVMALGAIVISVQLGRGWLAQRAALRPVLAVANSILVIVALVASVSVDVSYNVSDGYSFPPGMSLDGQPVSNVYVYGSDGQRISGVRLFDQEGRPLNGDPTFLDANGDPTVLDDNGNPMGAVRDISGAPLMNVYPRGMVGSDPWQVTDPANPQANRLVWTPPMSIVPLTPTPSATPSGTPSGSAATTPPAPTATSKPQVPKSAAPTPTSGPSSSVTPSSG